MEPAADLRFNTLPNTTLLFPRALLPRPVTLAPGSSIPRMVATLSARAPDAAHLARYRALCGFAHEATLPITYPHLLAAPLHLALMTHKAFPLRIMGAVHVRNRITQQRAIRADEPLEVRVHVEGHVEVEGGYEVDVHTRVLHGTDEPWSSVSTMLLRTPRQGSRGEKKAFVPPDFSSWKTVTVLRAPEDMGRAYGRVAADLNPIHVHAVTARAFGFPRAIAHGMWSFARCLSELLRARTVDACTVDVAFKRPLLLPSSATLVTRDSTDETAFALHDGVVETVYLQGSLRPGT